MSGYRPQNSGNRSAQRLGPTISRRLRAAGWNVSPAARKHKADGIYVSAMGDFISVLVDLGGRSAGEAQALAETVRGWGCVPQVKDEAGYSLVHFTYGR